MTMQGFCSYATTMIQAAGAAAPATADAAAMISERVVPSAVQVDGRPHPGDVVTLGLRVPEEYRGAPAVVTAVAEKHCTVVVLDESRRYGLGECWPGFEDLIIECRHWRLNSRVCISGLQSSKTNKLNGFCGTICVHKREGHPTLIRKPSMPDKPQLMVCVRLDDPELAGQRVVLLEPCFLQELSGMLTNTSGFQIMEFTRRCQALSDEVADPNKGPIDHTLAIDRQQPGIAIEEEQHVPMSMRSQHDSFRNEIVSPSEERNGREEESALMEGDTSSIWRMVEEWFNEIHSHAKAVVMELLRWD
eukprot:TRINITY_DN22952_c0_g1_i1.p1 TRINITY_DN22952_c0_g1~~TRINITY_DN22952_c0_g1_i1.p1  ORF type:complete len:304 (-),score=66.24 TRINITY_DN22952_c0_g1_i1:506-1417(-)